MVSNFLTKRFILIAAAVLMTSTLGVGFYYREKIPWIKRARQSYVAAIASMVVEAQKNYYNHFGTYTQDEDSLGFRSFKNKFKVIYTVDELTPAEQKALDKNYVPHLDKSGISFILEIQRFPDTPVEFYFCNEKGDLNQIYLDGI